MHAWYYTDYTTVSSFLGFNIIATTPKPTAVATIGMTTIWSPAAQVQRDDSESYCFNMNLVLKELISADSLSNEAIIATKLKHACDPSLNIYYYNWRFGTNTWLDTKTS